MKADEQYTVLRPQHLRDVNESAVLRRLIAHGSAPRSDLAHALGLTPGPMTRIVARLAERGLVRESSEKQNSGGRGRPKVPVELVPEAGRVIAVHIGARMLTLGVTGLDGQPSSVGSVGFDGTWEDARRRIGQHVVEAVQAADGRDVLGVGVIIGGHVDSRLGVLRTHPTLDWSDVAIRRELADLTGEEVSVESSARAHAVADILFGTVDGARNFVHLFVGNVVEAAVVVGGRVISGVGGGGGALSTWTLADDEGRAITAEAALGDRAVVERARSLGVLDTDDADLSAMTALLSGVHGSQVRRILLERAERAGALLAQLHALLAPELFVLSSGVLAVDGALEAVRTAFAAAMPTAGELPEIRTSSRGTNPLIGSAAAVVLDRTLLTAS